MVERLFIAVAPAEEARHALAALLSDVEEPLPGRPVPPGNWHLTLRFLGDVEESRREKIMAALDEADLGRPFRVRLGELGAFPRPSRATVLWVGFSHGEGQLQTLAQSVESAVETAGMPPEDRPFRAHLTVSRIRPPKDVGALVDGVDSLGVGWTVDRIVLYRSHLGRRGVRYEEVAVFPLGG